MASGPIISWEIDGETAEAVANFILEGSKITADGDYSHEIKRCLLLGRKVMTNLDSILKSRHYFANKGPSSQGYGFPNNLRYADDTILMAEGEEELKSLLMKMKEESEKVVLKFNIQKTKIMASLHGK